MLIDILITVLITLLVFILYYVFVNFNYWPNQGIPNIKPSFPFGNIGEVTKGKISFTDQISEFYKIAKLNNWNYVGLNFFHRKVLLIKDPNLIKRVLNTDFKYFHSRGIYVDEQNDPLTAHLVSLNGEKWKKLRAKLTPTFTPNKLKTMFDILLNCANEMSSVIKEKTNEKNLKHEENFAPMKEPLEVQDISLRYTTDVVGSSAFGIECNSLKNPNAEFRKVGLAAITPSSKLGFLKRIITRNFPNFAKKLKLKIIDPYVTSFFLRTVEEVVSYRQNNKVLRNDFLQLLINLMSNENVNDDDDALTIKQVAAQCFVFFIAGVETSAATISFALYELAKNKDFQDKVREEINRTYEECGGQLTYDGVLIMGYMEKVILETMRKYPAFTVLMRICSDNYCLPNSNGIVEKGSAIIVPVYAMHHDPKYFPNPSQFDPERFSEEEIKNIPENVYLPFGDGPRICIGRRFAMFQIKLALATTMKDFVFTLNEKSRGEIQMSKNNFILSPVNGIYLDVRPIETTDM